MKVVPIMNNVYLPKIKMERRCQSFDFVHKNQNEDDDRVIDKQQHLLTQFRKCNGVEDNKVAQNTLRSK